MWTFRTALTRYVISGTSPEDVAHHTPRTPFGRAQTAQAVCISHIVADHAVRMGVLGHFAWHKTRGPEVIT